MSRSGLQAEKEVAMYGEKDLNSTEERLRKRIRNAIAEKERPLPPSATRPIEDGVLALMKDYIRSPVQDRERVYEEHEAELLKAIDTLRRNYSKRSSSNASEG